MRNKIFSFLFFLSTLSYGQSNSQLSFHSISGLSQSTVYSILKDKQGFLWVATANGLNRFDGTSMNIYKPSFIEPQGKMKGRIIRSALLED
ncbi:MAG: two-component regulator propeller domain-containing protein, partial [Ferruginibacter sp.]